MSWKLEAAEASGFGAAWNGSQTSPRRFRTNGRKPQVTKPVQFDSTHTWGGNGKLLAGAPQDPTTETFPQAQRVPSRRSASVPLHGQQRAAQSLLVPTCTGLVWFGPGPRPNCPLEFSPQAQRVPSRLRATEWLAVAATLTQSRFESSCVSSTPEPAGLPTPPPL